MDLQRLRTLRELHRRKTMAAVADALLISASAVSQQIALLEAEVDTKLIERRGRGVTFTPAGLKLVAHAENILGLVEVARTDLAELKQTVAGEIRIAAFPSVAATIVPAALRMTQERYPHLDVILTAMEPSEGLAALRAWQADIALIDDLTATSDVTDERVDRIFLHEDELFAILPTSHVLSTAKTVTLQDLRGEKWALDVASHVYSDVIRERCRQAGFEPQVKGYCNDFEVVLALIRAGCCISVMPGLRLRHVEQDLCIKRLSPPISRSIMMAVRANERRNPALAVVVDALQEAVRCLTNAEQIHPSS
ncbi:LysR family transcriptional regulator [Agrobacterium vitis]|uniref:LysR family transcriptional regulator n=1 Tax=Agrobacterium vitis TaxID=373 RepID=A0A1S2DTE0_AGRVI|nr:LysR family transcriptional regulator [Agrobacterium vitis]MCE6078425.1 LysR family transcriptional regulator [Agrobacterium vitis]MCM2453352.1 LysR family transcriptional regulator [Agrobacterium vitis]MUO73471.1 LysR family transcriptional regulator [Agrobacterium vitis]MUO87593.1 LysR family transcriptional regulator [Agrobacterium vitis]MUZ75943.1 LysR family transcriptional regulator [Agrobacterium vitis]